MNATKTINAYLDQGLAGDLATVLCTGHAGRLLDALPEPWPEIKVGSEPHPATTPTPCEVTPKPIDGLTQFLLKGGPLVVGGAYNIPTLDNDPLLAGLRGRWRRPLTLQRKDFEGTFASRERRVVKIEEVLAGLRAGKFATPAALARYYGKAHSWTNSFKWFLIREKHLASTGEWDKFFPKRITKKPRQRQPASPLHSGPIALFKLPVLDEYGEAID